jgi:SAM-dependent methyltransferase
MLTWYLDQIRNYGLARATRLFCRVSWRRVFVILSNMTLPAKLICPCCGWEGRRFFDYSEMGYTVPNAACPRCDSHSRHRALFIWLRDKYCIHEKTGIAFVFSPERALAPLWRTATNLGVFRLDLEAGRGADILADLMRLPIASNVADLAWCHHVVEQVLDVRVALSELCRVLRPGKGELIISVGLGEQEKTIEFGFSDKTLSGNRRRFGSDFARTLAEAGFDVIPMAHDLTEEECRRYGIRREPFYRCVRKHQESAQS